MDWFKELNRENQETYENEEQHEETQDKRRDRQQAQLRIKTLIPVIVMVVFSLMSFPFLLDALLSIIYGALPFIFIWVIYKVFTRKVNEGFSSSTRTPRQS